MSEVVETRTEEKSIISEEKAKELQAMLDAERKERAQACAKEIEEVLKKHKCSIDIAVIVTSRGNIPQMNIVTVDGQRT